MEDKIVTKYYTEYENNIIQAEARERARKQLAQGFHVADIYLNRSYLDKFSAASIVAADRSIKDVTKLRLVEIEKITFDENEKFLDKLTSVYSALYNLNSSVALLIESDGDTIRFFIGTRSEENVAMSGDILDATIHGNFPGINSCMLSVDENKEILSGFRENSSKSLASVSVIPSFKTDEKSQESFVQGLEKFIDTMSGKAYTMCCLATPLAPELIAKRKHGYEELYSTLSPHAKFSVSYGKNESTAINDSISSSFSTSVNRSISNSNTNSTSESSGRNRGYSSGSNFGGNSNGEGGGFNWGFNNGSSSGSFDSYTSGNSFTESVSDSTGSSESDSRSKGETKTAGTSDTITLNYENKGVGILMERAQQQLGRFKDSEAFGLWEFSGYFMSRDVHTTVLAANAYRALVVGKDSHVETSHINIWSVNQKSEIEKALDYILHLTHPKAEIPAFDGGYQMQLVTPTNLVSGNELPMVMGFPKKSVSGLAVINMAEFGRTVVYENKQPEKTIEFGNVYHMGVVERPRVKMDLNLLASHCFITGSSGSGKSYATYQLLNSILNYNIKMMVIEPAKGEYKQIFGGLRGIKIYTTDPNAYRMLKINPFQFPEHIHLLSHLEQLLQIFNASWPLYAAMPAILKQSVVNAYIACGWDVQNSIWIPGICDHKYPVFKDVLKVLPDIINKSDYSADSKGDYKGALLTRVQSMTTGINGVIFKESQGIEDSVLFNSNVIVDLSELGSEEAIALIMGILIMKLNEYRKSQRKSSAETDMLNAELQHVTVLEEAHNLLKRTSKNQNQEGANMVGKSVEMISNSIKEMRTYGEGFIIIDQSPMAVDSSAIENTATKIIMNTPAKDACEELGSALSLSEAQTRELSRLNVGVAAAFQKGWMSPVLMKVDMWKNPYAAEITVTEPMALRILKGKLVQMLLEQKKTTFSLLKLRSVIKESAVMIDKKREFEEIISKYNSTLFNPMMCNDEIEIGCLYREIIGCEYLFDVIPQSGIFSYRELADKAEKESHTQFNATMKKVDRACIKWLTMFADALKNYCVLQDDRFVYHIIMDMIYAGYQGKHDEDNKFEIIYESLKRSGILEEENAKNEGNT